MGRLKLITTFFLLFCFSLNVFSDEEKKKREEFEKRKAEHEKKMAAKYKKYVEWRSNPKNEKDGYFLYKDDFVCWDKAMYARLYNDIKFSNQGNYSRHFLKRYDGCWMLNGWAIARIIKTYKDSQIVKIEYKPAFTTSAIDVHVARFMMKKVSDHKKELLR